MKLVTEQEKIERMMKRYKKLRDDGWTIGAARYAIIANSHCGQIILHKVLAQIEQLEGGAQ